MLIALMSDAAPPDQRSLALSLRAGVNQASSTIAPVLIGPLMAVAGAALGFPVAAVIGAGFLAAAVVVGRGMHEDPDPSGDRAFVRRVGGGQDT
jgi:hypothetical protein